MREITENDWYRGVCTGPDEFLGEFLLTGVEYGKERGICCIARDADVNALFFCLNGTVHCALEDPDDGYRSMLRGVRCMPGVSLDNSFGPVLVAGEWKDANEEIFIFRDVLTGLPVLEMGTDWLDRRYPCCVLRFTPGNMAINSSAGGG